MGKKLKEIHILNTHGTTLFTGKGFSIKDALRRHILAEKKANKEAVHICLDNANLERVDLSGIDLTDVDMSMEGANLRNAQLDHAKMPSINLTDADLSYACMTYIDLTDACLTNAVLTGADLTVANLTRVELECGDLDHADLHNACLRDADLSSVNLSHASLRNADLTNADLHGATLTKISLKDADMTGVTGLVKIMGVEPGNIYWKRFSSGLINNGYRFYVGLNTLRNKEVFASDERKICSYPGFHFASRSWCADNYTHRPYEARIRLPENAKINEPWGTDGKASADMIEILQVFDTRTGEDVTDKFRRRPVVKKESPVKKGDKTEGETHVDSNI